MNVMINRLDPNVPDPVESRRRAAGKLVRISYAASVFGVLAFFVIYFGAPFVFLSGPGIVTSPRHVVSLPYTVQVSNMYVGPGSEVKLGDEIGQVRSPQQEQIVATYMQTLADLTGRQAELRVKARVAHDALQSARSYLKLTEEATQRLEGSGANAASLAFRVEIFRERAQAQKNLVVLEAEASESAVQLSALEELAGRLRGQLGRVEISFADGRIFSPIDGIVSTNVARSGQSLVAGTSLVEILDPRDVFVDWYIPNARLIDPRAGNGVFVRFGNRRISGRIAQILPLSDTYAGTQMLTRDRQATQIARIRFDPGVERPALNSTVYIHMYYSEAAAQIAGRVVRLFGLQ
jgi:multidrug resistance efflux pump